MSALGSKLFAFQNGAVLFYCPGCETTHAINVKPAADGTPRPIWWFNGNGDAPTFTPSVLATNGHYVAGHVGECWCDYNRAHPDDVDFKCGICHSFVTDGRIQFLSDCTHALAGQTVDLPDWRPE